MFHEYQQLHKSSMARETKFEDACAEDRIHFSGDNLDLWDHAYVEDVIHYCDLLRVFSFYV